MNSTEKPKPCPLCGCTRIIVEEDYSGHTGHVWLVLCGRKVICGLTLYGRKNETREQVIKRWDTRP